MADEPRLRVTRTMTITQEVPLSSYPDMTLQQALDYEKGHEKQDHIQAMIEASEVVDDDQIKVTVDVEPVGTPQWAVFHRVNGVWQFVGFAVAIDWDDYKQKAEVVLGEGNVLRAELPA